MILERGDYAPGNNGQFLRALREASYDDAQLLVSLGGVVRDISHYGQRCAITRLLDVLLDDCVKRAAEGAQISDLAKRLIAAAMIEYEARTRAPKAPSNAEVSGTGAKHDDAA